MVASTEGMSGYEILGPLNKRSCNASREETTEASSTVDVLERSGKKLSPAGWPKNTCGNHGKAKPPWLVGRIKVDSL